MPRPSRPTAATPPPRRRWARRRLLLTAGFSVAAHGGLLLALLTVRGDATKPAPPPEPITVELVDTRPPTPPAPPTPSAAPPTPAKPAPPAAGAPPPKALARPTPAHPAVETLAAGTGPPSDSIGQLSEAQIAGAAPAGSGPPGRACDMTRRLQTALRKDARVQAAVADAQLAAPGGKALLVWNGDWIRSTGQEGNGLAAVREAIMWEVAFAPGPCRAEPVHGLILVSLSDGPGAARLVVGAGDWRWSDLLGLRR